MEADEYLSLKSRSEGLFKSKGSKHFGYACPVTSKDDVKRFIEELKIEHHSWRENHWKKPGQIASQCFDSLDASPSVLGSVSLPAIPLNSDMEAEVLPNAEKVTERLKEILNY